MAVVYGSAAGIGGLGLQAATVIAGLARGGWEVFALGPGYSGTTWPLSDVAHRVRWATNPPQVPRWTHELLRWRDGLLIQISDRRLARWAACQLDDVKPDVAYFFTQVGLEGLRWCRRHGVPSVLDNPNGDIRNFRDVCVREWTRWCGGRYHGHPILAHVERVEAEYRLADCIRTSSLWAKMSMVRAGYDASRIAVVDQPLDLNRFVPPSHRAPNDVMHLVFVGSIDVRKGVLPLIRALRTCRATRTRLTLVGGTGSRGMRIALARESRGVDVTVAPGDPVPAYQAADVFVLPSLEDGFGFVTVEAMACGLPVIATDQCGSAEWVARAGAGWVVAAGDERALAEAIRMAALRRAELPVMGARGRSYAVDRAGAGCFDAISDLVGEVSERRGTA